MESCMESWLRCNKCYRSMKNSTKPFSLTQCQHVFCHACLVKVEKQCPECNAPDVKTVTLVKPLPQALQHYFGSVRSLVQKSLQASSFQRTQMLIALRRFAAIQDKYDDMKRTYYQSAQQMKSLTAAYKQLKEKYANIAADIAQLRLMESRRVAETESPNFMLLTTNHRVQQSQHMMDYVMGSSQSRIAVSCNDTVPSNRNSLRSSITTPFGEHPNRRSLQQSVHLNRPGAVIPDYCPRAQSMASQYPVGTIFSRALPSTEVTPPMDAGWVARNKISGSLGDSSNFLSSGETMTDSWTVNDNYFYS